MLTLWQVLQSRKKFMEHYAAQGVIPGQLDSIELQQMLGRIEELKFVLSLLNENDATPVVSAHSVP